MPQAKAGRPPAEAKTKWPAPPANGVAGGNARKNKMQAANTNSRKRNKLAALQQRCDRVAAAYNESHQPSVRFCLGDMMLIADRLERRSACVPVWFERNGIRDRDAEILMDAVGTACEMSRTGPVCLDIDIAHIADDALDQLIYVLLNPDTELARCRCPVGDDVEVIDEEDAYYEVECVPSNLTFRFTIDPTDPDEREHLDRILNYLQPY